VSHVRSLSLNRCFPFQVPFVIYLVIPLFWKSSTPFSAHRNYVNAMKLIGEDPSTSKPIAEDPSTEPICEDPSTSKPKVLPSFQPCRVNAVRPIVADASTNNSTFRFRIHPRQVNAGTRWNVNGMIEVHRFESENLHLHVEKYGRATTIKCILKVKNDIYSS